MEVTQVNSSSIHPGTQIGLAALTVADLPRSLTFYRKALGFELLDEGEGQVTLGAGGTPLLVLSEHKGARPWPRDGRSYTGLYHFAILVPTRADLGRWLRHWLELGFPLPGQGDHLVSEALYLEDPDGNGIEIYRDRPREEWPRINGEIQMASDPVDIRGVMAEGSSAGQLWAGMPAGTRIGHMHLQVADIPKSEEFYSGVLGFDVIVRWPSALFISAGGYHHHIGMNTWHSRGSAPAPEGTAGLRYFTITMPDAQALAPVLARLDAAGIPYSRENGGIAVEDPWHNRILFQTLS
jgi:catechol 2,3-dioxygenase